MMSGEVDVSEIFRHLPATLMVVFIFGGWIITAVTRSIADSWRRVREAEQNAALKQSLVEKGMSAGDIERVLNAGRAAKV